MKKSILQVVSFNAKRFIPIVLSPWVLAVPFTVMIILFLPSISRYKATFTSQEYLPGNCFFYTDIDGDGITEKAGVTENSLGNAALKLYDLNGGLIEQVNFRHGLIHFPPNVSFGDSDRDGFGEIYFFTFSEDSVFLGFSEPLGSEKFIAHERFIDRIRAWEDTIDFTAGSGPGLLKDMNQDGYEDLLFYITARHSIVPRQVYMYDIRNDTIWRSGSYGSNLNELKIADINGDGHLEVMGNNMTRGNTRDKMNLAFGDSSAWLMVYDHELTFLFDPVEFSSYGVKLEVQPFMTADSGFIAVLYRNLGVGEEPPAVILYNSIGGIARRKEFSVRDRHLIAHLVTGDPEKYSNLYLLNKNGKAEQLNQDLRVIHTAEVKGISKRPLFYADLDGDRSQEIIFENTDHNGLVITRNDFTHPVEIFFNVAVVYPRFSIKVGRDQKPRLAIQAGETFYVVDYDFNRLYWLKGPLYLLIYAGILLFILLVRKLQQIQIRRHRAAEKELLKLQLLTIKNQVDPHFTFNALNAINSLILKEKKEDAYKFASKLSHLMRTALENSDKITTSLKEELDFIRNYLDLQKVRFRDSFDYQIAFDGPVDPAIQVPRHILQTYVENAVKHGLRPLDSGGVLRIGVSRKDGHLLLTVRDNGVGRANASAHSGESTGKGLGIMRQIFALYERLYHVAIEQEIVDLQDESGNPAGTEVRIRVPGM
ncbi:MAG TPA: histidine kinase [Bacteroidales bacterium]|nr:histidine kinase [Bacteroidales bacterium]HNS47056.1 histidine kinase [Bacteroidales bacterium]